MAVWGYGVTHGVRMQMQPKKKNKAGQSHRRRIEQLSSTAKSKVHLAETRQSLPLLEISATLPVKRLFILTYLVAVEATVLKSGVYNTTKRA